MSSNNEQLPQEKTSKNDLLDELKSIKGLLDDDLNIDIPILDDVVNSEPESLNPPLTPPLNPPLNPEDPGYEEEQEEMFTEFEMAPHATSSPAAEEEVNMDLLIQEIIDEFIPTIEDQLRQRLSQCSPAVIKQLAEKHLCD